MTVLCVQSSLDSGLREKLYTLYDAEQDARNVIGELVIPVLFFFITLKPRVE